VCEEIILKDADLYMTSLCYLDVPQHNLHAIQDLQLVFEYSNWRVIVFKLLP